MNSKISALLRIFISLGLVLFLLWSMRDRSSQILSTLQKTNIMLFSIGALLFILNVCILSFRLGILFQGEGLNIHLARVMQLSFIGYFFNNFLPTAVGGDVVKAYYAYKQTKEPAKSFIAVFMDRFIGLFSFMLLAVIALFFTWDRVDIMLKRIVFLFAISGAGMLFVILNTKVAKIILKIISQLKLWNLGEKLSKIYRAVHEYRNKTNRILLALGISLVAQSMYFFIVYILAKSLGANIFLSSVFLIMPLVSVVSLLPSLGGLGLREGAMVVLFGPIIGSNNAFSVSILLLATLVILSLIGAVIYISASQFKFKKAELSSLETYSV